MSSKSPVLSRSDAVVAGALVFAAIVLVAGAAYMIDRVTPDSIPNPNAEPVLLEAPVTELDIATAELAIRIRDALDQVESDEFSALPLGGFRNSGRGWFARADSLNYQLSIAAALDAAGALPLDDSSDANSDILVHQCGEFFGVLAASTVLSEQADLAVWESSGCHVMEGLVRDGPVFLIIGGR